MPLTSALPAERQHLSSWLVNRGFSAASRPSRPRGIHSIGHSLKRAAINLLKMPIAPILGYILGDLTGFSSFIVNHFPLMERIIGEGFGHVGLCYSLHYLVQAAQELRPIFTFPNRGIHN